MAVSSRLRRRNASPARKPTPTIPRHAVDYCLKAAGLTLKDLDYVAFYDKPFLKFERLLETYLAFSPSGFTSFRMALPLWLREKLFLKSLLADELKAIDPISMAKRNWCSPSTISATPRPPSIPRRSTRRRC